MNMRRMATVFVIAVLVPTLVLAWLAMRSLRDQEIVATSQRAILHQSAAESLSADLNSFMEDVRVFFYQLVDELVEEKGSEELSRQFDKIAPERWSQCSVACVVTDQGKILSPSPTTADPRAQAFLKSNAPFLLNQSNAKVWEAEPIYQTGPKVAQNRIEPSSPVVAPTSSMNRILQASEARPAGEAMDTAPSLSAVVPKAASPGGVREATKNAPEKIQLKVEVSQEKLRANNPFRRMTQNQLALGDSLKSEGYDQKESDSFSIKQSPSYRNVQPSQQAFGPQGVQQAAQNDNWSRLEWGIGNLEEIVQGKSEGALSRFLQDGLHVLLWNRHPAAPDRIFWVELDLDEIKNDLSEIVTGYSTNPDICLALLDAEGTVVCKTAPQFSTDWTKPFVASEVGQILPYWEVAAYLVDPTTLNRSARTAKLMIWLLVPTLLGAIAIGTFLIFRAIGMEMRLARQKTDFVSNVSHELKTPLTSIRMFSDMLTVNAASDKDREYSGIISREAARLTRLINNLLDFSRLERRDKPYARDSIDLAELTRETVETYRMQLEADGCHLIYQEDPNITALVSGDRDALSQVLLNLLSNAEKYGCAGGEIEVRLVLHESRETAEWQVLDRGDGIDSKYAKKIFEKFYRIDDSLTNGVPGSGVGLALARQIVDHHGGEITFSDRPGGGTCFSVILPIEK